ncbi:MAG: hypothetical protein ACE5KM_14965 [Planctomycetaceae bacterium]
MHWFLTFLSAFLMLAACRSHAIADGGFPPPVTLEAERDAGEQREVASLSRPLFRLGDSLSRLFDPGDAGVVRSLRNRGGAKIQTVRTLSIPNPLALLGRPSQWHGRFRAAYGSNFDDRSLVHGNFIIDSGVPFGLDTEFNYRQDERRILADRRFWNGDANVVYHLKQIRYVAFRIGVGLNWLNDGADTDVGFNTTYGFDVRLKKPWYFTTVIDYGTLGSDSMLHWQISGGLDFGRFELFVGYDFFEVGTRERKNVIAGVGLWY